MSKRVPESSTSPRIGQRVRFTRCDHPHVPPGRGGMIDQLGSDGEFFVLTDCGGFFGWTAFDSWEATGEPDVVLNPEYVAMRTQALCDDSSINAYPVVAQGGQMFDSFPPQLDSLFEPIKRGGTRCVKCRICGLEFFEDDEEQTEAHDRGNCRTALNNNGR